MVVVVGWSVCECVRVRVCVRISTHFYRIVITIVCELSWSGVVLWSSVECEK